MQNFSKIGLPLTAVVCGALTFGCASNSAPDETSRGFASSDSAQTTPDSQSDSRPVARTGTLYERLGGAEGVRKVVDDFVARAATDPAVNFARKGHANAWQASPEKVEHLKQRLVEYVATLAGGPSEYQYRGEDMVTAHRGMGISNEEFDALAKDLRAALESNNVPEREREELLDAVASTRHAIVQAPDASNPSQQDEVTQVESNTDEAAPVTPVDESKSETSQPSDNGSDNGSDEPSAAPSDAPAANDDSTSDAPASNRPENESSSGEYAPESL